MRRVAAVVRPQLNWTSPLAMSTSPQSASRTPSRYWRSVSMSNQPALVPSGRGRVASASMDACGCDDFASIFDRRTAEKDRDRYRKQGPDRTTRMLLDLIGRRWYAGTTLLDIGGGIGVIDREPLRSGVG